MGKSSGNIRQFQDGHAIHALLIAIIWEKKDVSQLAVLRASGALPTIKIFLKSNFMNISLLLR
jgi:hypothetical protein